MKRNTQQLFAADNDMETILHEGVLRSGQDVSFDGNVVVLGDVNPGAEIVAAGNVVVMGVLRGTVYAGAKGSDRAVIVAFRLQPVQLRIANFIARSPDGEVLNPSNPEMACVRDGALVIQAFPPSGERLGKK